MQRSITPEDWEQLAPLIDLVLDAEPDRRAALLDELYPGDPARRVRLERLVEDCERAHPLLDRPAAEAFSALLADEDLAIPEALSQRYRIERELGRGGMAVVYLAHDLRHGRDVAVKVIRPEVAAALGRDRFLREIAIAARLHHPNVVPLYDSGEAEGVLYYVMPFEPGASLRERLARDGPLPLAEAVRILRDVCDALAHAHQHGIVHRDIKPDNVLLAGRRALVADFGVAKAVTHAAGTGSPHTTAAITLGTPTYMAPEQIGPHPDADHRADIYAVGLLGYEILGGRPPFRGRSSHEVLAAHLTESPRPLAALRADLPPVLAELVMKCLEKRPEDRWQQAEQLVTRLDEIARQIANGAGAEPPRSRAGGGSRILTGAAALAAMLLAYLGWERTRDTRSIAPTAEAAAAPRDLFLVAEFTGPTADSALGPVIAQAVRDALAASPRLAAVSTERVTESRRRMRLPARAPLTAGLARELAMREEIKVVVEGSYRRSGTGVALSARLVEAATGDVIHAATAAARDSTDLPGAIERLSAGLREGLGEPLAPIRVPTGALWSYTTASLPALEKLQLAIASRAVGDYLRAIQLNQEAVVLDPDFAIAYVAMASNTALAGLPAGPMIPRVERAFHLADSLPERDRQAVEAFYHWYVTGDVTRSAAAFQGHLETMERFPGEAGFVAEAATMLQLGGDAAGAERMVRAMKENMERGGADWPAGRSSGGVQLAHVQALHAVGGDAEAARILAELGRRRPDNTRLLQFRIGFLADSGRYDSAHALAAMLRRHSGLRNDLRAQAEADAVRGRLSEAVGHLRELRDQAVALGQTGAAIEIAAAAARLRLLGGDSGAVSELDDLLARRPVDDLDVFSRPYLPLALSYAQLGEARRARGWLRRYEQEFPAGYRGPDRWMLHRATAAAFIAEGDPARALAELREASLHAALRPGLFEEPLLRVTAHPELARVYRQLGEPDSALAVYRRYLAFRSLTRIVEDAFERGPTLEALGALYEARGEHRAAAAAYGELAELWRHADPRLAPRVEAARRRASALSRR